MNKKNQNVKILIADDDTSFCKVKSMLLKDNGYNTETTSNPEKVQDLIQSDKFDLVLLDLNFGEADGIDILEKIKNYDSDVVVILITAFSSLPTAVKAVKKGAYDYLQKEISDEELLIKIQRGLEKRSDLKKIKNPMIALKRRSSGETGLPLTTFRIPAIRMPSFSILFNS